MSAGGHGASAPSIAWPQTTAAEPDIADGRRGSYLGIMTQTTEPAPNVAPNVAPNLAATPEPRVKPVPPVLQKEIGGTNGPEPTRYGDWEHKGRCTDF